MQIQKQIEEAIERLKKIRSTHGTYCGGWHDMDNFELNVCGECQAIKEFIDKQVEPFLTKQLNLIATKSAEGRQAEIMQRLQAVEAIAEDEQKHKFAEHCPCLRYAIWRVENPDADEMVYVSTLSKPKE